MARFLIKTDFLPVSILNALGTESYIDVYKLLVIILVKIPKSSQPWGIWGKHTLSLHVETFLSRDQNER